MQANGTEEAWEYLTSRWDPSEDWADFADRAPGSSEPQVSRIMAKFDHIPLLHALHERPGHMSREAYRAAVESVFRQWYARNNMQTFTHEYS
jgi:hypothetical protein